MEMPGRIEPDGFEGFVPIMTMEQHDELLLTVPYVIQYHNCSVAVVLAEHPSGGLLHSPLTIENHSESLTPASVAGGGTDTDHRYRFAVAPRIPDEQAMSLPMTFHVDLEAPGTFARPIREGIFRPDRFKHYVFVRAVEQRGELLASVPYVCQYNNCTVVVFRVEHPSGGLLHAECDLRIEDHEARVLGGALGGVQEHGFRFAVVPPIPDDQVAGLPMTFQINPGTAPSFPGYQPAATIPMAPATIRFPSGHLGG